MENKSDSRIGLLDLPPEIWSTICKLAVTEDEWIYVPNGSCKKAVGRGLTQPNIAKVSKAIRLETLPHWYAQHTYYVNPYIGSYGELFAFGLAEWIRVLIEAGWWQYVRECRVAAGNPVQALRMRDRIQEILDRELDDVKVTLHTDTKQPGVPVQKPWAYKLRTYCISVTEKASR